MLQHFDYPETWSYEGNAGLSEAAKFGKACAQFRDSNSYVRCTNTTGVYNLKAKGNAEAECFVKADKSSGIDTEILMKEALIGSGYSFYDGHVFKLYTTTKTWTDADSYCKTLGGHLVSVTSEEKRDFLGTILSGSGEAWTCGYYENGAVTWLNGDVSDYVDWHTGHPDGNGPYIQLFNSSGTTPYHFDDIAPEHTRNFICEWDSLEAAYYGAQGYKFFNDHTFKYFAEGKAWAQAKALCEALGGHLATSTSAEKNTFLTTVSTNTAWLGGTDEETEGTWKWITGEEWNYTNWYSGQPDNNGGTEHYLELNNFSTGAWNDHSATETLPYICEWDYDIRTSSTIRTKLILWDNGIVEFEGHFLKCVEHDSYTWQQAKEKCESMGGCLASVTSAEKQTLIQSLCNTYAWLGGQEVNSQWTWLTGETWGYTNWNSGEPSESGDGVGLRKNTDGTWAARKTDTNGRSICEWDNLEAAYYGAQGYSFYNGHTFKYYSDTKLWPDAKAACEAIGGHLATSTSAEKNTFLTTVTTNTAWLGGTDEETEGTWKWITGEEWNYTNWGSGEPNNSGGTEHCLELDTNGVWNDKTGTATRAYICEWDYDMRESTSDGISTGTILSIRDTRGVVSASDAEAQGYKFYNGHTFKYYSDTKLWPDAKAACEALGGHLATAPTEEKNTFLTTVTTNTAWLGGTDEETEGTWKWITGEEWNYTNWDSGQPDNSGGTEHYLELNTNGKWNDANSATRAYICEWDYDMREPRTLTLSIADGGALSLVSPTWGLNETSTLTLDPDTWYHVLLRFSKRTASVYLDGEQALSGKVSGEDLIPESIVLGGYTGYMDEFVFRNGAGTGSPIVPTLAYEMSTGSTVSTTSNAPVTRVAWSCNNLPEGLTLSSSGVLSGHPTTAGTYNCDVSVATNWGTATKTIKITVA